MNADYPANPATPGAHPFPGVTQAVPQGPGGPESAPAPQGVGGPVAHSQSGAGGGAIRPNVPAMPPPSPYASTANPGTPASPAPSAPPPLHTASPQAAPQRLAARIPARYRPCRRSYIEPSKPRTGLR